MGNISGELFSPLVQPRQIRVWQLIVSLVPQTLGHANVVGSNSVTDTARTGVEESPNLFVFIHADFDEVVAAAKSTQLYSPIFVKAIGVDVMLQRECFKFVNTMSGTGANVAIIFSC